MEGNIEELVKEDQNIVSIFHKIQKKYNYLPSEVLEQVSEKLNIPLSHLYRIATFYKAFSLNPKGQHQILVCKGTACHVRKAAKIIEKIETTLGIRSGQTTNDKKFNLETVNCLGVCALGPVILIGDKYYGQMTPAKVDKLIKEYSKK